MRSARIKKNCSWLGKNCERTKYHISGCFGFFHGHVIHSHVIPLLRASIGKVTNFSTVVTSITMSRSVNIFLLWVYIGWENWVLGFSFDLLVLLLILRMVTLLVVLVIVIVLLGDSCHLESECCGQSCVPSSSFSSHPSHRACFQ